MSSLDHRLNGIMSSLDHRLNSSMPRSPATSSATSANELMHSMIPASWWDWYDFQIRRQNFHESFSFEIYNKNSLIITSIQVVYVPADDLTE